MDISNVGAQMYSFRDYIKTPAGVRETFQRLRKMGYQTVQLSSSIAEMPNKDLKMMLDDCGLKAVSSHDRSADIINTPEKVAARLRELDCHHTAYPFPLWFPTGEAEAVVFAEQINEAALKMKPFGVKLAYHNHSHEFRRFDGRTMLEIIYDHMPDVDGEPDTFWVQRGGGSPVEWVKKLSGRLEVIHLKDYVIEGNNDIHMASIGDGNLNWQSIISEALKAGTKSFIVEHDGDCPNPFYSFERSINYLKGLEL